MISLKLVNGLIRATGCDSARSPTVRSSSTADARHTLADSSTIVASWALRMAPPLVNEELKVQLPAIDWLKKSWGYREIKSAEEDDAWGAPIDSLGLMDGRTLLIEVKVAVSGGNVRYNPDRSGSIEGKVARTLNGVFDGRVNYNWPAIRQTWERTHPLVFVLLAKTYTDAGLEEAKDVLRRRSSEWPFDCRIWQWNGAEIRELTRIELNLPPSLEQYDGLRIPTLVEHSDRSRPPSRDQHREEADAGAY